MAEHLTSSFPSLNILINNAGIQHQYDFKDDSALQKIDEEIDINFGAVARLSKILLPKIAKSAEAAIVNVSSFLGIVPKSSAPIYCATKAALHAFSQSLRYQLRGAPVKVFEIITPLVDTDMTKGREDNAGKMSPDILAREVFRNLERDNYNQARPDETRTVPELAISIPDPEGNRKTIAIDNRRSTHEGWYLCRMGLGRSSDDRLLPIPASRSLLSNQVTRCLGLAQRSLHATRKR